MLSTGFQTVQQINGEACTVQGLNSDVILHVPKGVHGKLLANIHTDPAKFIHHIPKQHCLVAPICEYHLQPSPDYPPDENVKYTIQIPHIVADTEKVRNHIRVLHGNISSYIHALKVVRQNSHDTSVQFDMDDKYITIYTSHFSGFIVTAEAINCCAQKVNVLIFGSLRNISGAPPLATVKILCANSHIKCKDYIDVSI